MHADRLVAHRGYPRRFPENTLVGIEAALKLGARHVEVDVQLSADRVPVLFHDISLRRVCGVAGAVRDLTLEELRGLRASEPGSFGDAFRDVPIATLEEFCGLLRSHPAVNAFVEIKPVAAERPGAAAAARIVLERVAELAGRCALISFSGEVLREARLLGWSDLGWILERWSEASGRECAGLAPGTLLCNVRKLPRSGTLSVPGRRLAVYDVVDPAEAESLVGRGVDLVETFAIGEMLERFR